MAPEVPPDTALHLLVTSYAAMLSKSRYRSTLTAMYYAPAVISIFRAFNMRTSQDPDKYSGFEKNVSGSAADCWFLHTTCSIFSRGQNYLVVLCFDNVSKSHSELVAIESQERKRIRKKVKDTSKNSNASI